MATAAPVVFTNSDAPVQPDAPTLGPQLPSLPQVPLWQLQEVKQSHNMNSLLEEQLNFLDTSLKFEISAHNEDRRKQHNYLVLSMKQERELMQARAQVQHLNVVVYELRTQIQTDRLKRKEAEDSLSQLLQEEMERFCCGIDNDTPPPTVVTTTPAPVEICSYEEGYVSPSEFFGLEDLTQSEGQPPVNHEYDENPEAFAFSKDDLEDSSWEKQTRTQKRKVTERGSNRSTKRNKTL